MKEISGDIVKLQHQIDRARKLADCLTDKVGSNLAELKEALSTRPDQEEVFWAQLAIVANITTPSPTTRTLTIAFLTDREANEGRLGARSAHKTAEKVSRAKKVKVHMGKLRLEDGQRKVKG